MLRISSYEVDDLLILQLEGKLAGPWVSELEKCLRTHEQSGGRVQVCIDLCGLTFIDDRGKELLKDVSCRGAELVASGCLMRAVVAELADRSQK